jgi:heme oxygenase
MEMAHSLSLRLREGTRESHRLAEGTAFIRAFFAGRLPLDAYREFLAQLRHVYIALESAQERHRAEPVFGKVYFPELARSAALVQDLDFYFGKATWREIPPLPATETYMQRIATLADEWPAGLVSHHYTRYLGDLSGGQALKRIVAKMYCLESDDGLAFYNFPQILDHTVFKNEYRARLMRCPLTKLQPNGLWTKPIAPLN